ncbi:MAG: LysM peptidoglycan-binding domain-containing protein [Chloroflexota bacterium]|jgi:LysM repeat protein
MNQKGGNSTRTLLALAGIAAFCAVTIFIAIAILVFRADAQPEVAPGGVPIAVGGQTVIIYPDPAMQVRIVSGQPGSGIEGATPQPTAEIGTGGQVSPDTTLPTATVPPPPTPTPWPPSVVFINYVVVPGDTLYRLTQKYNTSIDLMARYNIAAASIIVGNTLQLPVANPAFCPGSQPHVVRDQQTVSEIARLYGTSPQAIAAANGLDASYSVKTSQVICVPY